MNRERRSILMLILMFHVEKAAVLNTTTTNNNIPPEAPPTMDDQCGKKGECWKYFESKCYKLFHEDRYFRTSREECKKNDGDLVSIENMNENDFISTLIDESLHKEAWIGYELRNGRFSWVDGSRYTFQNWIKGRPRDHKEGTCVKMFDGGEWVNIPCHTQKFFICKKDPTPSKSKSNLRIILTITISVSCIFIMFTFVGFLCVKSHKELEAVESQVKEAVPFEIVKAAMVLPMAKPPDLLDHKVENTWQRTIKSITKPIPDRDVQKFSTHLQENANHTGPNIEVLINERKGKENLTNSLNRISTPINKSIPKTLPNDTYLAKPEKNTGIQSIENQPKLLITSTPSSGAVTRDHVDTNYLSKVDKWLNESPESPTRRNCTHDGSVRRKHFQQRGSQKGKAMIREVPELEENFPFNANGEEKPIDSNNTLDSNFKKTLQRQNVISVTADVNFPRNNSASTASDTDNVKSPCLGHDKRRKRPVLNPPEGEEINGNFLFLKTLTYSQETDFSDLSDQRNEERLEDSKLSMDEEHEKRRVHIQEPNARLQSRRLKDEYQLVTFV